MAIGENAGGEGGSGGSARRYMTILFADLSNSTGINETIAEEDYDRLLDSLQLSYARAADKYGGEVVRIDGDNVVIVFGYRDAHEDEGRRAVETALDIRDAAAALRPWPHRDEGAQLHSGIHSGRVNVRPGDIIRGKLVLSGHATNIASRLANAAGPGEILVSEWTLAGDRRLFEVGERRWLKIRGKEEPVAARAVSGRGKRTTENLLRGEPGQTPFVGRTAELAQLRDWMRKATSGPNQIGVVRAVAGLGKTRLIRHFLTEAAHAGVRIASGFCRPDLAGAPLHPFMRLGEDLNGETFGPDGLNSTALGQIIVRIGRSDPIIIFIDDWQWADDLSRHTLEHLRTITDDGVLFILATREMSDLDVHLVGASVLDLQPFGVIDQRALVEAMLPGSEPFAREKLIAESDGNVLLLEELCRAHAAVAGREHNRSVQAWVDVLAGARLAGLTEQAQDALKAASVLGHAFSPGLFETITGVSVDSPLLAVLQTEGLLLHDAAQGVVRFKHGLVRDAVYGLVGLQDRRHLHGKVVDLLRGEADAFHLEALAFHCTQAGRHQEAADLSERAGDKWVRLGSLDRAQSFYREEMEALDQLPRDRERFAQRDRAARKYGAAAAVDPAREHLPVLRAAVLAAEAQRDDAALGWALLWLGQARYGVGDGLKAIDDCRGALAKAVDLGDARLLVQAEATLGQACMLTCRYDESERRLRRAVAKMDDLGRGRGAATARAYSLGCLAFIRADRCDFEESELLFEAATAAISNPGLAVNASIRTLWAGACFWGDRYAEGVTHAERALAIAEATHARFLYCNSTALIGFGRWKLERSDSALQALVRATGWLSTTDNQHFQSLNQGWLAEALVDADRQAEAIPYARRALARADEGERFGEAMACRALAHIAARGLIDNSPADLLARAYRSQRIRGADHERPRNDACGQALDKVGD